MQKRLLFLTKLICLTSLVLLTACSMVPSTTAPSAPTAAATVPSSPTTASTAMATAASATAAATTAATAAASPTSAAMQITVVPAETNQAGTALVTPTTSDLTTTPAATPAETQPGPGDVTLAQDGKTITMKVGETFLLKLGENYNWTPVVANENIVSRVRNIAVIRGAQGVYKATAAGQTTLMANGEPLCRSAKPACGQPNRAFQITIVVTQ